MTLWLRAERLFTGTGAMRRGGACVAVEGGRIGAVSAGTAPPQPQADDSVVTVAGGTILPGFIEAHTHLHCSGSLHAYADVMGDSLQTALLRAAVALRTLLGAGVTTARDLGSKPEVIFPLREAVQRGIAPGPHLIVAGAPLTTTGGHFHFMGGEADSVDELLRVLRQQVKAGADFIKIMATGGALTPNTNTRRAQFGLPALRAVVEEGRRLERAIVAHCHATEGIRAAAAAGVSGIVHCSWLAPGGGLEYDPAAVDQMLQHGIVVDPTLAVGYRAMMHAIEAGATGAPRERYDLWQARLPYFREMLARGVPFIVGTDSGMPNTGFAEWAQTPALFVRELGMAPLEAIAAGTSGAARALGIAEETGTLAAGKRADITIVRGDPETAIEALFAVDTVVRDGELVKQDGRLLV